MSEQLSSQLTRDEQDLIRFYRELPQEKQLEILEAAEYGVNALRRMRLLAGRPVEKGLFDPDAGHA
ncbi:hypothetical protein EDC39_10268 [Geothermobacter ehrlichii]|uniref:Uncharacterized protein n=1 Tax=Geothermobacter ehrlichii TaxID=213224 RepID=A0A5D3WMR7_9BACT|nr:hypothetical protein [Geothermobacter ehrlichii]TYO99545.1 hypothetical protein EDC39_10268 [Geothermobacter ehrlichii]